MDKIEFLQNTNTISDIVSFSSTTNLDRYGIEGAN